jgi:hypothetical protein
VYYTPVIDVCRSHVGGIAGQRVVEAVSLSVCTSGVLPFSAGGLAQLNLQTRASATNFLEAAMF